MRSCKMAFCTPGRDKPFPHVMHRRHRIQAIFGVGIAKLRTVQRSVRCAKKTVNFNPANSACEKGDGAGVGHSTDDDGSMDGKPADVITYSNASGAGVIPADSAALTCVDVITYNSAISACGKGDGAGVDSATNAQGIGCDDFQSTAGSAVAAVTAAEPEPAVMRAEAAGEVETDQACDGGSSSISAYDGRSISTCGAGDGGKLTASDTASNLSACDGTYDACDNHSEWEALFSGAEFLLLQEADEKESLFGALSKLCPPQELASLDRNDGLIELLHRISNLR